MSDSTPRYSIGVMKMTVETRDSEPFHKIVDAAAAAVEATLSEKLDLGVSMFEFSGPHLAPTAGAYSPLDFLKLGLTEKLERGVDFMLMVTEVDLSASTLSYVLALPSQLTNVGILSTRRLAPEFWGDGADPAVTQERLRVLMLHTIGHLLNLNHSEDDTNAMYDFRDVENLDKMTGLTDRQIDGLRRNLPIEARERVSAEHPWLFAVRQIAADWRSIWHAVVRANPFRLVTRLPTMITAALSVNIVLFFSAEVWDVGGTVELYQVLLFSLMSIFAATTVLYRAFSFGATLNRRKRLSESTVVTEAATVLSLLLTMLLLYLGFFTLSYLGIITIFPRQLMTTWPTVDPAVKALDHVKLSLFLAAMGVLAGSLGGRADSKELIRDVLFLDEET